MLRFFFSCLFNVCDVGGWRYRLRIGSWVRSIGGENDTFLICREGVCSARPFFAFCCTMSFLSALSSEKQLEGRLLSFGFLWSNQTRQREREVDGWVIGGLRGREEGTDGAFGVSTGIQVMQGC